MKFSFTATIYKAGINPYVTVPLDISEKMKANKGYIPVKGKINKHPFKQTLVPVKNEGHRLYVNGPMLKGSDTKTGDTVKFIIAQDDEPRNIPMSKELKKALIANNLAGIYSSLTPGRQKEILRYLDHLKTEEALTRNIDKVIAGLKKKIIQSGQLPA